MTEERLQAPSEPDAVLDLALPDDEHPPAVIKDCWDLVRHIGSLNEDKLAREVTAVFESRDDEIEPDLTCLSTVWASKNEAAWSAWHEG